MLASVHHLSAPEDITMRSKIWKEDDPNVDVHGSSEAGLE